MTALAHILSLFAVLVPARLWVPAGEAVTIKSQADSPVTLVLTDFAGRRIDAKSADTLAAGSSTDLRQVFPDISQPGVFVLFAYPPGQNPLAREARFLGTPVVVSVRASRMSEVRGPVVTRIEPLQYAVIHTSAGDMTAAFYYDSAANTVDQILTLMGEGFYDGLKFNRILPGYLVQTGDPRGDGYGDAGFHIDAEFSDRPHEEGALSMARHRGKGEVPGIAPEAEAANSAGSQFFIALNYENTRKLDRISTVFGRITEGLDVLRAIAAAPLADANKGRPQAPPTIDRIEVLTVNAKHNPYVELGLGGTPAATTRPAEEVTPRP